MERAAVQQLIEATGVLDDPTAGLGALAEAGVALRRLRGWLDSRDTLLAARLAATTSMPEQTVAHLAKVSARDADNLLARAAATQAVPALADALADGSVRGAHVDVFTKALASLEPHQQPQLEARAAELVDAARYLSPEQFGAQVRRAVRDIHADDGRALLERQKADSRLRTWIDRHTGMVHLAGRLDPETGLRLHGRLAAAVEALYTDTHPPTCPTDPGERQDHLRALALIALTEGRVAATGKPELVVVVDTAVVDANSPRVDWGLPIELPTSVLERWFPLAEVHPVVLCNGAVLHAPGQLDLGRTTRLANRAQRRALRALYPTCAIPGCEVRFEHLKLHHVTWWRHGGPTNLANLLPLCVRHHTAVHHHGWIVHLDTDRTLTLITPDGATTTTPPPRSGAPPRQGPPQTHDPPDGFAA